MVSIALEMRMNRTAADLPFPSRAANFADWRHTGVERRTTRCKVWPSLLMFVFYGLSLVGLNFALKTIELSVAYAVWSALGIMLVSVIGMTWFKEPVSVLKLGCLLLVVVGVVGLQLSGSHTP
jgi:small multidrug resistance pump